jgi:hypothetical protein
VLSCDPEQAIFEALPRLGYDTYAHGVSRNGSYVSGFGESGFKSNGAPLLWDELGNLKVLERPDTLDPGDACHAFEVSGSILGTRIVTGIALQKRLGTNTYVRWVHGVFEDTGIRAPSVGWGAVSTLSQAPIDASHDGRVIVGQDNDFTRFQAFELDLVATPPLSDLLGPSADGWGSASAVSDDGRGVGGSVSVAGPRCPDSAYVDIPALWVDGALGILPYDTSCPDGNGEVLDLSTDGSVAIDRLVTCSGGLYCGFSPSAWSSSRVDSPHDPSLLERDSDPLGSRRVQDSARSAQQQPPDRLL